MVTLIVKEGKIIKSLNISNSSIQIFNSCRRRFKYKYIDKVKTDNKSNSSNKNLSFGNSIHAAIAQFNHINDERYRSLEVLHNLLRKNWIRNGYTTIDEEKAYGIKALNMLEEYFNNPLDVSKNTMLIETMIYKPIDTNIMICGKIDKAYTRMDDTVEVLDYKTSDHVSMSSNPLENIQLLMYLLLAKERLEYYPEAISFYFLSQNTKLVHNVKEEDIIAANEYLDYIVDQILSEKAFPPSPTAYCKSNCEFYSICEAGQDTTEIIMNELELFKKNHGFSDIF